MKTNLIILALFVAILSFSCTGDDKKNQKSSNGEELANDPGGDVKPIHLTGEEFKKLIWDYQANPEQWVYKSDIPSVVDFYADWCKPCRLVAPIMDDLADEYKGKVNIYKVNVDEERELAGVFGIQSIPTVFFIPVQGKAIYQPGALSKEDYKKIIEENLLNASKPSNE